MVIINKKQLQTLAWRCAKDEMLFRLTKTLQQYMMKWKGYYIPQKGALEFQKDKGIAE